MEEVKLIVRAMILAQLSRSCKRVAGLCPASAVSHNHRKYPLIQLSGCQLSTIVQSRGPRFDLALFENCTASCDSCWHLDNHFDRSDDHTDPESTVGKGTGCFVGSV